MRFHDFQNKVDSLLQLISTQKGQRGALSKQTGGCRSAKLPAISQTIDEEIEEIVDEESTPAAKKFPTLTIFSRPKFIAIGVNSYLKVPAYNNFYLYFCNSSDIPLSIYRRREVFQRFRKEYPQLEKILTQSITKNQCQNDLKPVEPLLFKAYQVMASYRDLIGDDQDYLIR